MKQTPHRRAGTATLELLLGVPLLLTLLALTLVYARAGLAAVAAAEDARYMPGLGKT